MGSGLDEQTLLLDRLDVSNAPPLFSGATGQPRVSGAMVALRQSRRMLVLELKLGVTGVEPDGVAIAPGPCPHSE